MAKSAMAVVRNAAGRIRGGPCYGALQLVFVLVSRWDLRLARTRPHYGGTLRVEIAGDPWERPDGIARRLVYDGLTQLDPSGAVQPALALTWEPDNNNHRWQFRLRPGVHFHDGSSLTSAAVVASLDGFVQCGLSVDRGEGRRTAGGVHERFADAESCRHCWRAISF